jgi:hypothetical protein
MNNALALEWLLLRPYVNHRLIAPTEAITKKEAIDGSQPTA